MKKYAILSLALLILIPLFMAHANIAEDVSGRILLQVEQHGEAWYVYPNTLERYYLGRAEDAFAIMSNLGLGIKHEELISYLSKGFPSRLSGIIMLDVEVDGDAYYVDPIDLKGYFMGVPADAYELMRQKGLGITDKDLASITISQQSLTVPGTDIVSTSPENTDENTSTNFDVASSFLSNVSTRVNNGSITVMSNGLPNHETGTFPNQGNPNTISEQDIEKTFTLSPQKNNSTTDSGGIEFGIALNGILFEPLTAEYWNNDRTSGWNLEWSTNNLGFDFNNAHVQPDGTYHYHGSPTGLLSLVNGKAQTLIGFAADGFPIYVENLKSSWRLKAGTRPTGPGGTYDGTYVQDYEYVEGLGDLDECNGIYGTTPEYPDGTYYYVISDTFPVVARCFSGSPDASFRKGGGDGPGNGGPPGGGFPPFF